MKAAKLTTYTKNNIELELKEVPQPELREGQAVLRVLAAGVNPLDNMITRGELKLIAPYRLPQTAGNEVVGIIDAIDANVAGFEAGDRVFARLPLDSIGAFAEYVAVDCTALAHVPDYLSDIEAAAVPLTGLTIAQALALMDPEPGESIFISGGTGGVGAMAIPIAKAHGLIVHTNGSVANKDRVIALGADSFLDYKTEDYSIELSNIDYVLDTLGGEETEKQMAILKPGGHLVSLRGMPNGAFARRMGFSKPKQILFGLAGRKLDRMAQRHGVSYDFIFVESNGAQLRDVADLLANQRIKPFIDQVYSLTEVNRALIKVDSGKSLGKTVITVAGRTRT
ncbi:NADP-dependent oxidoreductase [Corynebacterium auriscanis]|uniref:NADP-dependent oxidoreductase n=1 Tax=Corynebacterium auriscanis TaxID=99807 RepID=UPI00224867DB|nr:NADP-dependent oxidoreductase [Corynebacterium auriscanis]MCX2163220.1 NADP-dependent oxidoreductase [Corynebacterium auriscanis]